MIKHDAINPLRELSLRSRGTRHPHVLNAHSGACVPDFPNDRSLATISDAMINVPIKLWIVNIINVLMIVNLAACGSTPAPRVPQLLENAQAADKDARRALRAGELLRAQHAFAKTLALQQALDDSNGAAITMINLATVTHQLHDDQGALAWLDKILLEKVRIYPAESQLIAVFRKAVILTKMGQLSEAEASLQQAEKLCEKKCSQRFGMDALRARLSLLKGDAEAALALAQAVSKEKDVGKEEQANALRVAAAAEEKLLRPANALQHYQAALEIDKVLGLSARIAEDLEGLARTSTQLGRDQDAATYARRAALVNESKN
jgi:tetratricopeptide (TPR) repeat protein